MSVDQLLARGRQAAQRLMTDTLRVTRKSGTPVTDPDTGQVSYPTEVVHDGIGRIQSRGTEATTTTTAGADVLVVTFVAQLPVTVPLRDDDQIEATASEVEPLMVGRKFRVESVVRKTHGTKTVAHVEEVP